MQVFIFGESSYVNLALKYKHSVFAVETIILTKFQYKKIS